MNVDPNEAFGLRQSPDAVTVAITTQGKHTVSRLPIRRFETGEMKVQQITQYLKDSGEQFDSEIALGTGLTLAQVKVHLAELSAKGEIIMCHSIQFRDGERIEGMRCRLAGYTPPAARGRKPSAPTKSS